MLKPQDNCNAENETDDDFEETSENRIKIEKAQLAQVHDDAENNAIETGGILIDEDTDDVFDEERDKREKKLGFENIVPEFDIKADEDNDAQYSQESLDLSESDIKQENDTDDCVSSDNVSQRSFNQLGIENIGINEETNMDGADDIKMEYYDIENEKLRNELDILKRILARPLDQRDSIFIKQKVNEKKFVNKSSSCTNINNSPNIQGRQEQLHPMSLSKGVCATKESQIQTDDMIKLNKQNDDVETNANNLVLNPEGEEELDQEVENLNNYKQQSEKNKDKNISEKKQAILPKIGLKNESNIKINTTSLNHKINTDGSKNLKTECNGKGSLNKTTGTDNKKQLFRKETSENQKKLSYRNTVNNMPEKVQVDCDHSTTTCKENDKSAFTTNKEKTQTETCTNMELCDKCGNQFSQTHTKTVKDAPNTKIKEHKNLHNVNVFTCTKCSYETESKVMLRSHFVSTHRRDILKLFADQLSPVSNVHQLQTSVIKNSPPENKEVHSEGTNKEMNKDTNSEKETSTDVLINALHTQNVETSRNIPRRMRTRNSLVYNGADGLNTENKTPSQNEKAFVINPKDKIPRKILKIDIDTSIQKNVTEKVNSKDDAHIEFSCSKCIFKTKRTDLLKEHLITHGNGLASGIITFLDIARNSKESLNQIRKASDIEADTSGVSKNIEADDKVDTMDDTNQNAAGRNVQSKHTKNLGNEGYRKIIDSSGNNADNNMARDILIKNRKSDCAHTDSVVINEERGEGRFSLGKEITATNVVNKSENMEIKSSKNRHLKIPDTNKRTLRTRKRIGPIRETSLPRKKNKAQVNDANMYCCDECSYQSNKRKNLNYHKVIHSKDCIKCDQCDFITNLKRNLVNHMLVHLKPGEIKLHKCPHCPYQTKRNNDMRIHMVIHKRPEELKMFQCDQCLYQSKRKSNLRSHQLYHKPADQVTLFGCAECSFKTKEKGYLRRHMVLHQKEEEIFWYKCDQCSFSTKYKAGLKKHGLVHKSRDEIRTYDCTVCPYRAKHNSHLKSHMLLHKDPKEVEMHKCTQCAYETSRKPNLLSHMYQHKSRAEMRMAKCEYCPYETKLKGNLRKHMNRRHKVQ